MASPQLPPEIRQSIDQCAEALGNVSRLKEEVRLLRDTGDGVANFAVALFELELAREGDAQSRAHITHLAEVLLVFWHDGSGDALARLHPAMQQLWTSVAPMLVQFEMRQFDQALQRCWKVRTQPSELAQAVAALEPEGHKRVEFSKCVYHLELARQGIDSSRAEFARRAGLLSEAYQDMEVANALVGADAGLRHLWGELKPYLDEFFEALEEQAARAQEGTKKVRIPMPPEAVPPEAPPPRAEVKTDPAIKQPELGEAPHDVPSFRTLVNRSKPPAATPPVAPPPARSAPRPPAQVPAPPPPPGNLTPPGSWVPEADLVFDEAPPAPPAPPLDLTPPGAWRPPATEGGDVELVDMEFDAAPAALPPPPPPHLTPAHGLAAVISASEEIEVDFEPAENTLAFWDYTFASLQLAPADGLRSRMLATESRTDRKRLTTWLDGLGQHLAVPEARAFASMVRLMLAAETKEKSLFGQHNPRRKEALSAAFAMLSPDPEAASHAAVWFDLDGQETRDSLNRGLELLTEFLAFCARHTLDPLQPASVEKYLET